MKPKTKEFTKKYKLIMIAYLITTVECCKQYKISSYICHILDGCKKFYHIPVTIKFISGCNILMLEPYFPELFNALIKYANKENKAQPKPERYEAPFLDSDHDVRLKLLNEVKKQLTK